MKGFLEYVPGDSLLHRMNPVAKLAAAFLLVIACFATSNLVLLALVIVLDAVLAVQCKMVSQTLGLAKAVALFSLVLALIVLLFTPQGDVLAQLPWGYIGTGSVAAAVLIVVPAGRVRGAAVSGVLRDQAHRHGECAGQGAARAV